MKKRMLKTDILIFSTYVILCAICIISGRPRTQRIWSNPFFSWNRGGYSIPVEGEYGKVTDGPGINLPVGKYRLQWYIEGDGENEIVLLSSNISKINPASFFTSPDEYE